MLLSLEGVVYLMLTVMLSMSWVVTITRDSVYAGIEGSVIGARGCLQFVGANEIQVALCHDVP